VILDQEGVESLDLLQTRTFGSRAYVDVEISAEGSLTLVDAHSIAERVHHAIEISFPQVKHCMVHVNPYREIQTVKKN
ncbi:MAG: cation transporter dimerization domain-containing protein, partial [Sphaerochaeta sp.]|nr:cation transporter dimerization domain-containing protein [Sphaerochaeta sp.]